jgi:hypothetical protein
VLRAGRLDRQDIDSFSKLKNLVNPVILSEQIEFHMSVASGQKNGQSNRKKTL